MAAGSGLTRDEKMLNAAVESISARTADLKNSLGHFIYKLENTPDPNQVSCTSMLDSFGLLSGQLTSMIKIARTDRVPTLKGRVCLPTSLSQDRDEELIKMTDGRIPAFSHDVVPDHLRTKLEPDIEARETLFNLKSSQISQDNANKQINQMNKIASQIIEMVKDQQEKSDAEAGTRASRAEMTSNPADTNALIAAITFGKGLRAGGMGGMPPGMGGPGGMGPGGPSARAPGPGSMGPGGMTRPGGPGGGPGPIRPNIRVNVNVRQQHPYNR